MVEKVLIGAAGLGIASLAGSVIGLFVKGFRISGMIFSWASVQG